MGEKNVADKYGTKKVQEYLLPILIDIDRFCRENKIEYSLAGGCLLGAVRHHGFVPWDDDADLVFDRKNYEKFMALSDKLSPEYVITGSIWVNRITRTDNPRIEQEEGCIDLFVLDHVPDSKLYASVKHLTLKMLQGMMKKRLEYQHFSFKNRVLMFVTHLMGMPFTQNAKRSMYNRVSQWGNKKQTKYINNYVTYFDMIDSVRFHSDLTDGYIDVLFEGQKLRAFRRYDHVLTVRFGDYMTPPPESKRVQKHLRRDIEGGF